MTAPRPSDLRPVHTWGSRRRGQWRGWRACRVAAGLAQDAYGHGSENRDVDPVGLAGMDGWEGARLISCRGAQALAAWTSELVVVAFRGTSSIRDAAADAISAVKVWAPDLLPAEYDGKPCRAGLGMVLQARRILPRLLEILDELEVWPRGMEVYPVGHSLGGGIATLLTAALRLRQRPISGLWTFGAPRTVNRAAARWWRDHVQHSVERPGSVAAWRVVSCGAPPIKGRPPVPEWPALLPFLNWGFRHVGIPAFLLPRGRLIVGGRRAEQKWAEMRKAHPLGFGRRLRKLGRLRVSARAHRAAGLVAYLDEVLAGAP